MANNGIAKPEDFKRALERSSIERMDLPASGLSVLLCRPPIFAALAMGREGTQLQARITEAKPEEIKPEDIEAFTSWLNGTLARLFVQPRFAASPGADEIGLADILMDDLKFIFRWLRGEVVGAVTSEQCTVDSEDSVHGSLSTVHSHQDLGRFPGGQAAPAVSRGSGEAQPLPPERAAGTHRHAGVSAGLQRG